RSGRNAVALGTLRRDEGGPQRFTLALAEAWAHGLPVDWQGAFPAGTRAVDLPTYAFQHRRYCLEPAPGPPRTPRTPGPPPPPPPHRPEAPFWAALPPPALHSAP
ncbi:hypothetical protein VM98_38245, partial [Streptomyces rubellomurinus subsp. indigoferus]